MTATTTEIQSHVDDLRGRASNIRATYNAQREQITGSPRLTHDAKQRDLHELNEKTNAELTNLQQQEASYLAKAQEQAERRAFSLGNAPTTTDIVALRDATDRAEAITDVNDAMKMYERAARNGDKSMVRALVTRAYETGMRDIIDHHLQSNPTEAKDFEALQYVSGLNSIASQFKAGVAYMPVGGR